MFKRLAIVSVLILVFCGLAFAECPDVSKFKDWELVMMRPIRFDVTTGSSHFDTFLKNGEADSFLNGTWVKSYWTGKTYWQKFAIVGPERVITMWKSDDEGKTYTRELDMEWLGIYKRDMEKWFGITIHETEQMQTL